MKISIIIPNYNSKVVGETIDSVLAQSHKGEYEIIVIGVDEYKLINENPLLTNINTQSKCPPSKARNIGYCNSTGEILVFLDSDCVAPLDWLEKIISPFFDHKLVAVGGGVRFSEDNYWSVADNLSMFHSFLWSSKEEVVKELPSLNLAVRRKAFSEIGGFNEKFLFPSGEDFDLTMRLSKFGKLLFFPDAWIKHNPPRSTLFEMLKHSFVQGKFSTKIDRRNNNFLKRIIYNKLFLLFFSPILAMLVTFRIFTKRNCLRYFYVFPAIYFSKIAWCFGAISSPWYKEYNKYER